MVFECVLLCALESSASIPLSHKTLPNIDKVLLQTDDDVMTFQATHATLSSGVEMILSSAVNAVVRLNVRIHACAAPGETTCTSHH